MSISSLEINSELILMQLNVWASVFQQSSFEIIEEIAKIVPVEDVKGDLEDGRCGCHLPVAFVKNVDFVG